MKQRGGDDRGSSTSLRVVLGATLALAGDAARRELTAPEGPAPDPVREAKKAQRAEKLPEPRFAAAETKLVEAKPGRKTGAKRERIKPAEARLPSPKLAKALPLPESAGVLSPEFREPIVPEPAPSTVPVVKPEAATSLVPRVAEAVSPPPEPPRPAALAANDP
ncbi:MAG: hypothetical protein K2X68_02000, partial [Novosphingobium sp.]|nr:hypothetical protein [Novosphingobium sp.]